MSRTCAVAAMLVCAIALAGCGSSGTSTATDGEQIFSDAGCAGCHTLSAAGSDGASGPNLDDLKPSTAAVEAKVKNGGGGMPAFEGDLTAEQITAVSEFVSSSAGQ